MNFLEIAIIILTAILAIRAWAVSMYVKTNFRRLAEAIQADIRKAEEIEMTAEEKIKEIEKIIKWTDEGLRYNELKGNEEFEYKAHNYDSIREIIKGE